MLVGGPSAIEYDVRQAAARDTRVIIPIALVVVLLVLILLLRSLLAPLLLIGDGDPLLRGRARDQRCSSST